MFVCFLPLSLPFLSLDPPFLPLMEEKETKEDQGLYRGRGSWPGTSDLRLERSPAGRCLSPVGGGQLLGAALAVDGGRDDASGVARALAAGVEPAERYVTERLAVAEDAHG